ncbi:DUF4142 domain-containing protein [Sorangium sp. So ce1036]|uniref:DUF4142 domain-containing protein n=1 Tax=Sorangium sp. So ce1036 TaxID=3133328 RepID=UPI003F009B01
MAALALGGASACSVATEDGDLAAAGDDRAAEAVESTSQAVALAAPDLAAVLAAFYSVEVAEAQLALTHATDQHVREFAQAMLDYYTAANQELVAALQQLGLTPQENAASQALAQRGAEEARTLEGLTGASFDLTYVNAQIELHRQMLAQLQEQLLVVGVDMTPGLSQLVPQIRTATSRNLRFATSLLSLMGSRYIPGTSGTYPHPYYGNGVYNPYPYYGVNGYPYAYPYNSPYNSYYGNNGYYYPPGSYDPATGLPRSGTSSPYPPGSRP